MKSKSILIIFIAFISAIGWSQTKLIEKVTKTGSEVVIPYEKYQLANGLKLIIHEDHSDPLVHVDVTYHVGSAREELQKSGFAHFFEHMMFQGSENVADEEHFKLISDAGGTLNGSTNRDRTNYYETAPSNQLELMLWMEADRMGFFLDAVTQEKFEVQRSTVKNEKGQNYDNRPYGRWSEVNASALYPYGHPYSWLTIGKLEDLDRVNVNDLKKFFMRWYGPNNATLTVGGDVNSKDVIKMAEKYFGVIPAGPDVNALKLDAATLDADRYVSYVDKNIRFPAMMFTFPTVPRFHPDEAPLDCLAEIIGTGQSSFLFKKFVLTKKAIQASSFNGADELAGEMSLFVIPYPGVALADFEKEMRQVLIEFEQSGVSDNDILKFKANQESNFINGLASVSGKVSQLASYETYLSNPNGIKNDLKRYQNITKVDVMRVYNKYIKGKPAVILSVVPEDGTAPVKADNYTVPTEGNNPFPKTDYSGLSYTRPTGDTFDRSIRPISGSSPLVQVPEFWSEKLNNGIKIIGTQTNEIPVVALQLNINGGHRMDMYTPNKSGLALLTAGLMNESTENYTSEQIQEELRKIGSNINIFADDSKTTISVNTLKKNLARTLEIVEEILYRPKFSQEDYDRVKKQQLEGLKSQMKDPSAIASNVYRRLLYGDDHIYAVPESGIEESVNIITLEDVQNFYTKYYAPELSELVVVGDISKTDIMSSLVFLDKWKNKSAKLPEFSTVNAPAKTKIYLVDKAEAPQSEIRIGYVTDMAYDATGNYFKSYLMNYPLGGAFNSRINLNLREDKGWTYGARSNFNSNDDPGPYTASAGVKGEATAGAISEFMKEITNYKNHGITDDELIFMRNSIGQRDARSYETPSQKASFLGRIVHYGLDKNFVDKQTQIINTISKEEINSLADKYLQIQNMNILVVGDKASNIEKLTELGYEIVELNAKGVVIPKNDTPIKKEIKD
ncbi:pitrilysin family protein [uncultured Lutibacter sp.]|uniref:M16 family metallopeptidase n=1 Tax=uncultured Lutibacter sp. TaxID=437739 RepID=UPI0026266DC6|nr:pitrilysin family protein [uncultured Lutibacter sp.]